MKKPGPQHISRLLAIALLFFLGFFMLSLTSVIAQTTRLSSFATRTSSNLRVSFTFSPRYPTEGQIVQFVDASSGGPVSWQWDFGDGTFSTERTPLRHFGQRSPALSLGCATVTRRAPG